jgi:ATPase family AAA domain-containing protein 2
MPASVPSARLLLCGSSAQAQTTLVAPALLLRLEHASVHSLEISALHGTPGVSPEEVCMQVFREAVRQIPSVIYVPNVDKWWSLVSDTIRDIFLNKLALLELHAAVLLLATANTPYSSHEMPQEVGCYFCGYPEFFS